MNKIIESLRYEDAYKMLLNHKEKVPIEEIENIIIKYNLMDYE